MKLTLIRTIFDTYTEGKLYIDGVYFCDTLENKDRGLLQTMSVNIIQKLKVYGETCIPAGLYKLILSLSPRFKKLMPEILFVKGFKGVRIHAGNTTKDTQGCILVGEKQSDGVLTNSRKTFDNLMQKLQNQKEIILIIE